MSEMRKIAELALSPDAHVFRERRGNCGPASMRIVLRDLGKDVPEARLARLAKTDREGTSPTDIVQAARAVGMAARAQKGMTIGKLRSLTESGTPVIVAYQDGPPTSNNSGHYSVVGAVDKNVHLSDPSSKKEMRAVPRSSFLKRWHDVDKSGRPWSHLGITMRKIAEHALQGHTEVQGIPIAIENRKGSVREGTTRDGHHWRTKMKAPYGYIEGTKGKDGEEIDAFVGPDKEAPAAYVVHQHKPDGTGFDEDKVIFGVRSLAEAKKLFTQHYDDPKFLGPIDKIPIDELREKLDASAGKQIRKLAEQALRVHAYITGPSAAGKSTFVNKNFPEDQYHHLHSDAYKKVVKNPDGTVTRLFSWRKAIEDAKASGKPVVVDSLNIHEPLAEIAENKIMLHVPEAVSIQRRRLRNVSEFDRDPAEGRAAYEHFEKNMRPVAERMGFTMRKLAATALAGPDEFAPGIPAARGTHPIPRVHSEKPETWHMAVQHHEAERAGHHIDFRLVDPQGRAHSWALPKAKLPKPGERVLAVRQPTHSAAYAARQGVFDIGEGYGKGRVRGSGLQPVEVVRSQPSQVRFNVYGGSKEGNQEFNLLQTGKGWLLQNISATAERGVPGPGGHPIPHSKPKYSEIPTEKVRFDNAEEIHQAKLDGAHVTYHLRADKPLKVFSYRPTERATGVLEHTFKLPGWRQLKAPPALAGTVLRGELYATDQGGKALPAEQVGGLLNASVWKSREKQEQLGHLKPAIFDVVRWKGRDVEQAPYSQKLEMLREVQSKMPTLHLPRTAVTEQEKQQLFRDIKAGKEPSTAEGIISWHLGRSRPTKAKFRPDHDAVIVGVTPGAGKHTGRIGALQVKLEGKDAVTHVGTGMSDKLRAEIAKNPDAYIGRAVKVHTQQVFPSGKLRAPSFGGFHLEKGKQPWQEEKAPDDESTIDQEKTAGRLEPPPKGIGSSLAKGLPALLTYKYMTGPYIEKGVHRHKMMMRAIREGWPAGMAAE